MDIRVTAAEAASFLEIAVQNVHKKLKGKGLEFSKSQNRVYFGHTTAREIFQLHFKHKIIGFQNLKGGVGKTELAFVSALKANLYGAKVLCIDLDMQGNLTEDCFKINADEMPVMVDIIEEELHINDAIISIAPGLDLIPSRIENGVLDNILMLKKLPLDKVYKQRIEPLRSQYDIIIIDCPPALGQSVTAATLAVDEIIAPVTPDRRAISGLKLCYQEIERIEKNYHTKIPLRVIINKFDKRNTLSHETLKALLNHHCYGEKLYRSYIRALQEFPNAIAKGETIFKTLKDTPAKEDIDLFVRELLDIEQQRMTD